MIPYYRVICRGLRLVGCLLLLGLPTRAESGRVEICHVSPWNPSIQREIAVGRLAAQFHLLRHPGDQLGPCLERVECPCWTTEELRSAVAALPTDPTEAEDAILAGCELSVGTFGERFSAELRFQDLQGVLSDGARVLFNGERMCIVFVEAGGLGLGLVPITVDDLDEAEAAACARSVGEICPDLLP